MTDRIDIYLNDHRLIRNVFIICKHLTYYTFSNPDRNAISPGSFEWEQENIMEKLDFRDKDILLIVKNNKRRQPRNKNIVEKILSLDLRKTKKGIMENEVTRIEKWHILPSPSKDDILRIQ